MVISFRPISRLKNAVLSPALMAAARAKSSASGAFPDGRPGRDHDHLPGVQAVGERVQVREPGRHPGHPPVRLPIASISSRAPGMMSAREW